MARANLPRPCLMLVTEPMERSRLVDVVREAVAGGVNVVQLRDKTAKETELLDTALALKEGIGDCPLLVNMRPTVATRADLAGVHLPGKGLRIDTVRAIIGPDRLIGQSVHSSDEAIVAGEDGADYLILGTVFASRSHEEILPTGTNGIQTVRESLQKWFASDRRDRREWKNPRATNLPIIAIGGITPENSEDCLAAGASGVAVLSGILYAPDPRAAARIYWERLNTYSAG